MRVGITRADDADRIDLRLDVCLLDAGTLLRPRFGTVNIASVAGVPVSDVVQGYPGIQLQLARVEPGQSFDLCVGRPDPADATRFLFDYTIDGHRGQIIGCLTEGDGLRFTTADGTPLPIQVGRAPTTRPTERQPLLSRFLGSP